MRNVMTVRAVMVARRAVTVDADSIVARGPVVLGAPASAATIAARVPEDQGGLARAAPADRVPADSADRVQSFADLLVREIAVHRRGEIVAMMVRAVMTAADGRPSAAETVTATNALVRRATISAKPCRWRAGLPVSCRISARWIPLSGKSNRPGARLPSSTWAACL